MIQLHTHAVHEGKIKAAEFAVVVAFVDVVEDAASFEGAAEAASENDRDFAGVMFAAGPHVGNEHQAGVIENSSFTFRHRIQLRGEVGKLAAVIAGDAFVGVGFIIVGGWMVGGTDIQERIEEPRKITAKKKRGDAGFVGLETERDDVAHQPHVIADILGKAVVGTFHGHDGRAFGLGENVGFLFGGAGGIDAFLDFTDAGEEFVELGFIGGTDAAAEAIGLIFDAIENALIALVAAIFEKAVEGQGRIDFHGHGGSRALP